MLSTSRLRIHFFHPWARKLEPADDCLDRLAQASLADQIEDPTSADLLRRARLDCDWHGECARCFATLRHPALTFLPAGVTGAEGLPALLAEAAHRPPDESWWLIFMGQHPQKIAPAIGQLGPLLRRFGVRVLFYGFDEPSRHMPCFRALAPHLDVLIHDEFPLDPSGAALLRPDCVVRHRSWVANVVPFSLPFNSDPEPRLLFLGSQIGLTPHRRRQVDFLQRVFKDRFTASVDHSVAVGDRASLNRFTVGVCPEGRKFGPRTMARTHTDRPFWSGCLGLVPVSENSAFGGRLDDLAAADLIVRYPHGDLEGLKTACERALAFTPVERRRIYDHFNRHETVGAVVAEALAAAIPSTAHALSPV